MSFPGRATAADPELGPVRFCAPCAQWWPDDAEFWYLRTDGYRMCKACHNRLTRLRYETRRAARARGLCAVVPCPVVTPRERCYFHAVPA